MRKAAKVTISLPSEVLEHVERQRQAKAQSRSEFILHAVEERLRRERERADVEQYIRGYQEMPETEEEIAEAEALAAAAISQLPWDDESWADNQAEEGHAQESRV